jgi:membrane-associated phospholipid phosphatase
MTRYSYSNFYKANIISLFAAIIIIGFSIMLDKNNLFLLLNTDLGSIGDFIFNYATYLGDGVVWALFAIAILWKQQRQLPITIAAIVISTIITHYVKGHLLPINYRPVEALPNARNLIHTIAGVEIHYGGSFPSGHTTQAFTMYFLLCLLIDKKWIVPIGFLGAMLVGYSRVYQAQHFPLDVAGGIFVALVTVWLSLWLQLKIEKKWLNDAAKL